MSQNSPKIILASSSSYRRSLLQRLGLKFEVASPEIDESALDNESARDLVLRLSRQKAEKIAEQYQDAIIIGSDQVACLGETVLTKPGNAQKAMEQLQMARGRTVIFSTGLALWIPRRAACDSAVVEYKVHFREYTDDEISRYLQIERPFDCAGSFKAEALGIVLFDAIDSTDPTGIQGLPLIWLSDCLNRRGIELP